MDYYSGAPDPSQYEYNDSGNRHSGGLGDFFKNNSFLVLLILAIVIAVCIFIFIFTSNSKKPNYNTEDKNSYLKSLEVYGGTIEPAFDSEVTKYTIVADSDYVSFECTPASKKSKVDGCGDKESVKVEDDKVSYDIKVTAEDGNVTRYYFTIIKSETNVSLEGLIE